MSNWYAKRLGGQQHPSGPPPQRPAPPTPQPQQQQPEPHYQRPTPSSLQTDHCPSCASANYMAPPGTEMKRCFDCGYPLVQSGTGVGTVGTGQTDGTVHRATQVEGGGYNPKQIVGRVE
jgi:hypothetical protein